MSGQEERTGRVVREREGGVTGELAGKMNKRQRFRERGIKKRKWDRIERWNREKSERNEQEERRES